VTYKRIMVPVNGVDDASHALDLAFGLGKRFAGAVMGLHAAAETSSVLPYMGESLSGALVEDMISALDDAAEARLQAALAAFTAAQQTSGGVAGQLTMHRGLEDDLVARHGRLADLVVVPRPASKTALSESPTMQAAILDTGRPVLVAPPGQAKAVGGKILIAWNGSSQAARAMTAAMPLLREAEAVTLLHIEESSSGAPTADAAVEYLAAHGCDAQAVLQPRGHHAVTDALLLAAINQGADLLVMGAYTHRRIRELIFGGATLEALLDAPIPVLMAH
jgi:nucleotide-binding universal stress UspA family protein